MTEKHELLKSRKFGTPMYQRINPFLGEKIANIRNCVLIVEVDEFKGLILQELPVFI